MDYKKIIKNRELRLKLSHMLAWVPSVPYLKMIYRIKTGTKLNIDKPVGFCDKMNWLKLNMIHPEYTEYVDKVKVRDIIENKLGSDYLFPLLGTWEHFDDIDFEQLPTQFVLKCNHDSGSVKLITDKNKINKKELKEFFEGRLKLNSFCLGREYPYKEVKPCIMAEKLMKSERGINDYKFFCFDGEPKIMFIATDRSIDVKFDFYDMDFNHLPIYNIHPNADNPVAKPECFEEMKEIAAKLSSGFKFVRIDLYEIDKKVYFGEYTLFHGGGFYRFFPDEWEQRLGNWIKLPTDANKK